MSKKLLLPVLLFFISTHVKSQVPDFEEILPLPPTPQNKADFPGIRDGSLTFCDIDNDKDPDLLITGEWICRLFINDGKGNFTEKANTSISKVRYSTAEFADVDNDLDMDLMIIGESEELTGGDIINFPKLISKLYLNDGKGNFTEKTGTSFEPLDHGDIAFEDIDGDNDEDLLITGMNQVSISNSTSDPMVKLYSNDGSGNFSELTHSISAVGYSSAAFKDIDNDGDSDLFLCGMGTEIQSKLYLNDGNGVFTEEIGSSFEGVSMGSAIIADVNQNNIVDHDLLITGLMDSGGELIPLTQIYLNDGKGNFSVDLNFSADSISNSSTDFADIDNDRDRDLVISGMDKNGNPVTKLYINNGEGRFRPVTGSDLKNFYYSSVAFEDVDGDGDPDLLIAGANNIEDQTILYMNDGSGTFNEVRSDVLNGFENASSEFADFDGDQDQDLIITGSSKTEYYVNDGSGNFSLSTDIIFPGTENGSLISDDFDGDGDADLILTGSGSVHLYLNDGDGTFSSKTTLLDSVSSSYIASGDADNDGDKDVFLMGYLNDTGNIAKLYLNDGSANFTHHKGTSFVEASDGTVSFVDLDTDGDDDILITGALDMFTRVITLYRNDGGLQFSEMPAIPDGFDPGISASSVDFADIENDGDLDLLATGIDKYTLEGSEFITYLALNDGQGLFSKSITYYYPAFAGGARFFDADSDHDPDMLISGSDGNGPRTTFYRNDGNGNFTTYNNLPFMNLANSNIAIADIDNDNDPDVLISGNDGNSKRSKLYRNNTCVITYDTTDVYSCEIYTVPSGDESYDVSGVYNDTITNAEGCDSIININLTISKLDTTVINIDGTLTSNAEDVTYQWLDCNENYAEIPGETQKTFEVLQSGSYAVKITRDVCIDTSNCHFIILEGSEITLQDQVIQIYPNPAGSEFTISGNSLQSIKIMDISGQLIKQINVNDDVISIDTEKFKRGIYFIRIETGKMIFTRKIILD